MKIGTKIVQTGVVTDQVTGAISTPIHLSSTFRHPGVGQSTGFDYSRTTNPTRLVVENAIAALEGGTGGYAFSSGMAAITALLMIYQAGDHVIVTEDCYGGTYRVLDKNFRQFGLQFTFVDGQNVSEIEQAIQPNTKAIIIETPTNPLMKIADIQAIAKVAKARDIHLVVDNTFLTPYYQRPLELGADIVVHSGTKYLSGHNDILCGLIVAKDPALCERIKFVQNSTGGILAPMDAWLLIRGIKTLALRMDKHSANALALAKWLSQHPQVETVYYPGLEGHPGKAVQERQADGYGGMLSFLVKDAALIPQVLGKVKIFQYAESLGGVESLITFPVAQTHADMPVEVRERLGISDRLFRVSVGVEDVEDLIADLTQALQGE